MLFGKNLDNYRSEMCGKLNVVGGKNCSLVRQRNGTTHLKNHLKSCQSRQARQGLKQSILTFTNNSAGDSVRLETHVFDQNLVRKKLALMICLHEYPLSIVDHAGFHKFCDVLQPLFKLMSRNTIRKDILGMYEV